MRRSHGPLLVVAGTVGVAFAQWYLVWLFAREGGASAVGAYSTLLAIATPLFIATQLGLRSVYVTLRQPYPWRTYVVLRALGIAAGIALLVLITISFPTTDGASPSLIAAIIALKSSDSVLDLLYSRIQKSRKHVVFGGLNLANAGGTIALATLAVLWADSVVAGVWASAFVSVLVAVGSIFSVTRRESRVGGASTAGGTHVGGYRALMRAGTPISAAQFLLSLTIYVPVVLVETLGTSAEVGIYAAASYLVVFANLVGSSVATVVLPSFALTLSQMGQSHLMRRAGKLTALAMVPGLAVVPIVVIFGPFALEFIYGPGYALPTMELALLAVASVVAVPSYVYSSVLLALNNYWGVTAASTLASLIVVIGSSICFWAGLPAVTAGCLMLCVGAFARGGTLFAYAHLTKRVEEQKKFPIGSLGTDG